MFKMMIGVCLAWVATVGFCDESTRWDFDNLDGWKEGSQNNSPKSYSIRDGKLRIHTRAKTRDRVKVLRKERFKAGTFTWRIYVPKMGKGDQAGIGAFLYKDDKREMDFEIGYGKAKLRKKLKAKPRDMICYCTTQGFPFSSSQFLVKAEAWHTVSIELRKTKKKNYDIIWTINGKVVKTVHSKIKATYDFSLHCSVENLKFLGDHIPKQENYALFDWVEYTKPIKKKEK